jgi:hypothetical protein
MYLNSIFMYSIHLNTSQCFLVRLLVRYWMKTSPLILSDASLRTPSITSQYIIIHPTFVIHLSTCFTNHNSSENTSCNTSTPHRTLHNTSCNTSLDTYFNTAKHILQYICTALHNIHLAMHHLRYTLGHHPLLFNTSKYIHSSQYMFHRYEYISKYIVQNIRNTHLSIHHLKHTSIHCMCLST